MSTIDNSSGVQTAAQTSQSHPVSSETAADLERDAQAAGTDAPRILLIDGHSLAFRAFFALPAESFSIKSGQCTNAVYGFMSMLFNVVKAEEPSHVAVAFDLPGGTFRTAEYTEYKAGRAETPQPFRGQVELIQKALEALGVRWLTRENFEADDIIATLTTVAEQAGAEVLISSGDRDALQLVTDRTTVLYPRKGVSDLARMTPAAVQEKYGVSPEQYSALAALVGESADNLPGVPGVGPKTAAKWINQYGSLESIIAHAGEIKGKVGEKLRDNLGDVERNRRLNVPVRDLPLDLDFSDLIIGNADPESVAEVFEFLEFNAIRQRMPDSFLPKSLEQLEEQSPEIDFSSGVTLETGSVGAWLEANAVQKTALSVSGHYEKGLGDCVSLGFASSDAMAYLDLTKADAADEAALAAWLSDRDSHKTVHDAKLCWHYLNQRGFVLAGVAMDTSLAEFICRPDQRQPDLSILSERHLGRALVEPAIEAQQELVLDEADSETTARSAMAEAAAIRDLESLLAKDVAAAGGERLLSELELPLSVVLAQMEAFGIAIDSARLGELEAQFGRSAQEAAERAYGELGGDKINLGSPKQLQEVLFNRLDMPKTRKTKTGYSTDAESLSELFAKTGNPFLEHLLTHRDVTKLRQIVETLRKAVAGDGRIHTTFHQTVAATGRLSSNNPNLQNIPVRSAEGRRIRDVFVVDPEHSTLLTADYSQIEMRIMAHLSKDEGLIEAFNSGEDLHVYVASRVFGVTGDQVDGEMRSKTKAVSYGLAYGLSVFGLSRQLGVGSDEAKRLREDYFARFGGVRDYLHDVVEKARSTGYTETIMGRRRYLPDLTSSNGQRRALAERVALNSPIQGSAADIIKLAMLGVERSLREQEFKSRMLLQVHDELVLEVSPGEIDAVKQLLIDQMGSAFELSVPLSVSVGEGKSWFEAAH